MTNNHITSNQIAFGVYILPIKRVETFSPEQWEIFIEEWLDLKKSSGNYVDIERIGGANDMGRDIIAYISPNNKGIYEWDCYQCKHYSDALVPTQIYVEIGKILYYTFIKAYPVPKNYYFIAPKGVGTSLTKLLQIPNEIKEALIANWDKYCRDKITTQSVIDISEFNFREYVDKFDFSIFQKFPTKNIIEEHSKHPNHLGVFGGILPERPVIIPPTSILVNENNYVDKLMRVYDGDCGRVGFTPTNLVDKYQEHFERARKGFHYAEQLKNFYRDSIPPGTFEDFQDQIYTGIQMIAGSGYEKVISTESEAMKINIDSNALKDVSNPKDRIGICHQLSNDDKILWIK